MFSMKKRTVYYQKNIICNTRLNFDKYLTYSLIAGMTFMSFKKFPEYLKESEFFSAGDIYALPFPFP